MPWFYCLPLIVLMGELLSVLPLSPPERTLASPGESTNPSQILSTCKNNSYKGKKENYVSVDQLGSVSIYRCVVHEDSNDNDWSAVSPELGIFPVA